MGLNARNSTPWIYGKGSFFLPVRIPHKVPEPGVCGDDQAIKGLGTERSSDQGRFSPIKILDPGRKRFFQATRM